MPRKGSQAAVAGLNMSPPSAAIPSGKEALESDILGVVTKGKSQGMGREAQGTQLLTAHSSSLHREHTMMLGNIPLCVLQPSNSEMSLVDVPLCHNGVQKLSPPHFTPIPSVRSPH